MASHFQISRIRFWTATKSSLRGISRAIFLAGADVCIPDGATVQILTMLIVKHLNADPKDLAASPITVANMASAGTSVCDSAVEEGHSSATFQRGYAQDFFLPIAGPGVGRPHALISRPGVCYNLPMKRRSTAPFPSPTGLAQIWHGYDHVFPIRSRSIEKIKKLA